MKAKQLIERNLKFSERYVYLEIVRGSIESGQVMCCDNCGKLITNMVKVVRQSDKKNFIIGTDCAETLVNAKCMYNNGSHSDYQMDVYAYNQVARFVTELNAGVSFERGPMRLTLINRKGKELQVYEHDMKRYFPEYL